jgi:hypothetical protein
MSPFTKLQAAISVVFVAVTINVTAQTPTETSSINAATNAASTTKSKEVETSKRSAAVLDNLVKDPSSEVSRDPLVSNGVVDAKASAAAALAKPAVPETAAPRVPQTAAADEWQFQVSPYFWLAGLHGTTGTQNRTTQVDESFSDIFHSLKFAFMGTFEARKDRFISLTDLEYVSLEDDRATPGPFFGSANAKIKTFIFDPEVGYRVFHDPDKGSFVDILGGIRVWHVSTDITFSPGILPGIEVQGSRNWVDAVGGVRASAHLSEKLFITGKFDLGGGGSKFTYQLFGGGGYNLNKSIALLFGYRALDVNYNKDNFVYDTNQRGPIVGIGFRF